MDLAVSIHCRIVARKPHSNYSLTSLIQSVKGFLPSSPESYAHEVTCSCHISEMMTHSLQVAERKHREMEISDRNRIRVAGRQDGQAWMLAIHML